MQREAHIFARIQGQKSPSKRHVRYLLDSHGVDSSTNLEFWSKGILKKSLTKDGLPEEWDKIDKRWLREKKQGGTVAKQSKNRYHQALITLPNSITQKERHSLAKQVLRLLPQKHPALIVAHDTGTSGVSNKHLHFVFSYRKYGYGKVDRHLQQGFEYRLKELLRIQYKKYGFKILENKKEIQVKSKPHNLMRELLRKHGRDSLYSGP